MTDTIDRAAEVSEDGGHPPAGAGGQVRSASSPFRERAVNRVAGWLTPGWVLTGSAGVAVAGVGVTLAIAERQWGRVALQFGLRASVTIAVGAALWTAVAASADDWKDSRGWSRRVWKLSAVAASSWLLFAISDLVAYRRLTGVPIGMFDWPVLFRILGVVAAAILFTAAWMVSRRFDARLAALIAVVASLPLGLVKAADRPLAGTVALWLHQLSAAVWVGAAFAAALVLLMAVRRPPSGRGAMKDAASIQPAGDPSSSREPLNVSIKVEGKSSFGWWGRKSPQPDEVRRRPLVRLWETADERVKRLVVTLSDLALGGYLVVVTTGLCLVAGAADYSSRDIGRAAGIMSLWHSDLGHLMWVKLTLTAVTLLIAGGQRFWAVPRLLVHQDGAPVIALLACELGAMALLVAVGSAMAVT